MRKHFHDYLQRVVRVAHYHCYWYIQYIATNRKLQPKIHQLSQ